MTGREMFQSVGRKLKSGVLPKKKSINELSLRELLFGEERIQQWAKSKGYDLKIPSFKIIDPDDRMRVYKYQEYALPRIKALRESQDLENNVKDVFNIT